MKKEVSSAAIITVALIIVVILIYFGIRSMNPPAASGYTPGVPPWKDPAMKAAYASGKAQAWRNTNDWHPAGQTTRPTAPPTGPVGRQ